jgi:hypothetical protein
MRALMLLAVTAALLAVAGAASATAQPKLHCASVRTNRFYKPAANGQFGAFSVEVSGATCTTARSVASKYARDPYSVDLPSHRTKTVSGWRCIWTADPQVAQQVLVGCTRAGARISFADRLPNG